LPLPHIFDRLIVTTATLTGAQIFFYGGDVLKLSQDILDVRPTILPSVPRLWNRFHDKIRVI
jgi:long-chain acyl-CoA synthetase